MQLKNDQIFHIQHFVYRKFDYLYEILYILYEILINPHIHEKADEPKNKRRHLFYILKTQCGEISTGAFQTLRNFFAAIWRTTTDVVVVGKSHFLWLCRLVKRKSPCGDPNVN